MICAGKSVSKAQALHAAKCVVAHRDACLWQLLIHLLQHAQQLRVRHLRGAGRGAVSTPARSRALDARSRSRGRGAPAPLFGRAAPLLSPCSPRRAPCPASQARCARLWRDASRQGRQGRLAGAAARACMRGSRDHNAIAPRARRRAPSTAPSAQLRQSTCSAARLRLRRGTHVARALRV